ncbi:MAG: hypothetical protein ACLFVB_04695 [Thermoplasmata archaeon]
MVAIATAAAKTALKATVFASSLGLSLILTPQFPEMSEQFNISGRSASICLF